MLVDGLTKLAPAGVISSLHDDAAMHGEHFPTQPKAASACAEPAIRVASVVMSTSVDDEDPVFEQDPWRKKDSRPANQRVAKKFGLTQLWGMIICTILRLFVHWRPHKTVLSDSCGLFSSTSSIWNGPLVPSRPRA
jgi:hypothetical protein